MPPLALGLLPQNFLFDLDQRVFAFVYRPATKRKPPEAAQKPNDGETRLRRTTGRRRQTLGGRSGGPVRDLLHHNRGQALGRSPGRLTSG